MTGGQRAASPGGRGRRVAAQLGAGAAAVALAAVAPLLAGQPAAVTAECWWPLLGAGAVIVPAALLTTPRGGQRQ